MSAASLTIELLTEELPARGLRALGERFGDEIAKGLARLGLRAADASFDCFATPRRLAVRLSAVLGTQPEQQIERKGPAVASGLRNGEPTQALLGFAKSCGVEPSRLDRMTEGKNEYFVYRTTRPGAALDALLPELVEQAIRALPAAKLMRWGDSDIQFIRPIHGILVLWGTQVLPGPVLGLTPGRSTAGHRFLGAPTIELESADQYPALLRERGRVIASFAERADAIAAALRQHAGAARLADESLVEEVAALVEYPAVYEGRFDSAFLQVPQECLMLTMKANQKYFPLLDAEGRLINRFLIVSNMDVEDPAFIIQGNERVLRARLSDARFFFEQDRRQTLADYVPQLASVVYHNRLGSQLERSARIEATALGIAQALGLPEADAVRRAAHLCKADLMTGMVGEFPELQGTMGMHYARHEGESATVSQAIEAHYRPRFAGGPLPQDRVGDCVALADKAETLVGIYGIGLIPTGDKDPFGLRRAALGMVRILVEHGLALDVRQILQAARAQFTQALSDTVVEDLIGFLHERLRSYLRERGHSTEDIEAVLGIGLQAFDTLLSRLEAVRVFRELPAAASLAAANKRIANILRKSGTGAAVDPALFSQAEEARLYKTLVALEPVIDGQLRAGQFQDALLGLSGLREDVDGFFDKVLVNTEAADVRENRLGLLTRLNRLMNQVADLSRLAA
jgi:glycyl-tRNA synthetase beta chain